MVASSPSAGRSARSRQPQFTVPNGFPVQIGDGYAGFPTSFGNEFTWKGFRVYGFLDWAAGGNTGDFTDVYFDFGPSLYADSAGAPNGSPDTGLDPVSSRPASSRCAS